HAHLGSGLPAPTPGSASGELSRAHVRDKRHRHGKGFTALLSVSPPAAFWGESDDSSSELEAALRPQTHSTGSDDFGDFYD
ncbi:Centrosomal protein kizuna, partial [Corvus brachyrhynchos]